MPFLLRGENKDEAMTGGERFVVVIIHHILFSSMISYPGPCSMIRSFPSLTHISPISLSLLNEKKIHRARHPTVMRQSTTRTMATGESRAHLYTGMPTNRKELKNSIWLADAGAYPVIFTLSFACVFAASFITYCAVKNPDVRITPGRRQQLLRTWEH